MTGKAKWPARRVVRRETDGSGVARDELACGHDLVVRDLERRAARTRGCWKCAYGLPPDGERAGEKAA